MRAAEAGGIGGRIAGGKPPSGAGAAEQRHDAVAAAP